MPSVAVELLSKNAEMGIRSLFGSKAILCVLLVFPELGWSWCNLGGNNTGDVTRRNNTIMYYMNNTAMSITINNDRKIANFSDFQLWNFIQTTFSVTSKNYLVEGVSLGKLLQVDWQSATQGHSTNSTDNRTLEAYIRSEFLDPLHTRLQEEAVWFSFSLGIFRPKQEQFNYTGVNASLSWFFEYDSSPLRLNCKAGSRFLWRLATSMEYNYRFDDTRSTRFARSAYMIENSFDQYYRKHSKLGNDFVRVNVLNAVNDTNHIVIFMEAYFVNNTYTAEEITSLTDMGKVPNMYFNNGTSKPLQVTLNAKSTYIVNATIIETMTTSGNTTVSTEMTSTTAVNNNGSTVAAQTTANAASATTATTSTTLVMSTASTTTTTAPILDTTTNGPHTTTQTTSENTTTTALPTTLLAESSTSSSIPTISTSQPVSSASDTSNLATTASNNADSSSSSTSVQSNETIFQTTGVLSTTNLFNGSSSTPSGGSNGADSNVSPTAANPSGNGANSTANGGLYTIGIGNGNGTTFDPDPLFQPVAPVLKNIYNDKALLQKISQMMPVTAKVAFMTITIPVVVGILLFVIFCIVCLQIDCCLAPRKMDQSDSASQLLN